MNIWAFRGLWWSFLISNVPNNLVYRALKAGDLKNYIPDPAHGVMGWICVTLSVKALYQIPRDHDNIIKIYSRDWDSYGDLWIIMEFCTYGNLNKYYQEHRDRFRDFNSKLDIMCQIVNGLDYLDLKHILFVKLKKISQKRFGKKDEPMRSHLATHATYNFHTRHNFIYKDRTGQNKWNLG